MHDLEIWQYAVAIVGGFVAGMINTLAGNGSAITLGILTEVLGLPATIANGTNRVGVFMQSASSNVSFYKNGKLDIKQHKTPILALLLGALVGIYIATIVSNDQFRAVFKYMLVIMLGVILINPKRWLHASDENAITSWWTVPIFLAIGFYGGFIQMGMGVIFLITTVVILRYNLISANVLKTAGIALYTMVALAIFHFNGLIDWRLGLIVGVGQAIGGYLMAEFASKSPKAIKVAYVLLITMVILAILSTFDVIRLR